ncbi:methyl-accepting chemotaxis protein [Acetivibrio straminisolvens]|jgi:methyl-accepting chemotaxis protein|nr:methyl-accepting chemotaxis protein [Acetivibrio straminisolvens]
MKIRFDVKGFFNRIKTLSLKKLKKFKEMVILKSHFIKNSDEKETNERKGIFMPFFRLKDVSIGIKLNVIVTLVLTVSLSIVIFYSFGIVRNILIEQAKDGTLQVSKQTSSNMRMLLETVEQEAMVLSRDEQIADIISNLNEVEDEVLQSRYSGQLKALLTDYTEQKSNHFYSILAISNNYITSISGQQILSHNTNIQEIESVKTFLESGENSKWYDPYIQDVEIHQDTTGLSGKVVTLAKSIFSKTKLKSQGQLFFYINYENLGRVFSDVDLSYDGIMYIVGNDYNIVMNPMKREHMALSIDEMSKEEKEQSSYINEEILKRVKSEPNGAFTTKLHGKEMLVTFSSIDEINGTKLGWTFVTVTDINKITARVNRVSAQVIIIGLICLAVGILLSQYINKDITKNIKKLVRTMEKVGDGNLSIEFKVEERRDEIGKLGKSFAKMLSNLNELIMSVKHASDVTVDASSNVSSKIQETYASIEQTNAVLEVIKEKSFQQGEIVKEGEKQIALTKNEVNQAKDTMKDVDLIISKSKEISEDNRMSVSLLHEMSQNIRTAMNEIGAESKELIETSREITKFTRQIKEISEQTKLIALNSAIESARLGAQGKTFHLLSEETRTLASKTKDLSGNIDQIIQNLIEKINNTNKVVLKLDKVAENTENSIKDVTESFDKNIEFLNDITSNVSRIKQVFTHIDDFVREIVSTIEYISASSESNIQDISDVSTAMNEQIKCQESLLEQTANLLNLSQELKKKAEEIS